MEKGIMGRSYFLSFLLVSLLLALSFSTGYGRKLLESTIGGDGSDTTIAKGARETFELMDYVPTGPNFNSRSALPVPCTTPPPGPPPSSSQPPAPANVN